MTHELLRPLRLAVSFPTEAVVGDLSGAIDAFHRFIQRGLVEGLVLDVADYRHVEDGPGVLLVGHDVDYGLRADGFTVVRKRNAQHDAGTQLRDALRMGLGAMAAIVEDSSVAATFDTTRFTVKASDRRLGSRDDVAGQLRRSIESVLVDLYGDGVRLSQADGDDGREAPSWLVEVPEEAAGRALARLGGSRAPLQSPWDISVEELARLRDEAADFVLLDVREESEYEQVNLGGTLVPLGQLGDRLDGFDRSAKVIVHCRAGRRGATAVEQLRAAGFADAWNVNGALAAWRERIDPTLRAY